MNKSHIHQFSYSNINKSSPLTYLGLNFYFFVSEKFILFTRAILLLEKLLHMKQVNGVLVFRCRGGFFAF